MPPAVQKNDFWYKKTTFGSFEDSDGCADFIALADLAVPRRCLRRLARLALSPSTRRSPACSLARPASKRWHRHHALFDVLPKAHDNSRVCSVGAVGRCSDDTGETGGSIGRRLSAIPLAQPFDSVCNRASGLILEMRAPVLISAIAADQPTVRWVAPASRRFRRRYRRRLCSNSDSQCPAYWNPHHCRSGSK